MIYKSKIDFERLIVLFILLLCISIIVYFLSKSIIIAIIFFSLISLYFLTLIKYAYFYENHLILKNTIFHKSIRIDYIVISKIILYKQGSIRFEVDPSLIVIYKDNMGGLKEEQILINDDAMVLDLLRFLKHDKGIRIEINSKLLTHKNLKL